MMNLDSMFYEIQATVSSIMLRELSNKFFLRRDYDDDRILDICHHLINIFKSDNINIAEIFDSLGEIEYIVSFRNSLKLN